MSGSQSSTPGRRLRNVVEPLAANVYFAPEAQEAYGALDLSYPESYFTSRGGCLGQVPGEVIAAAFGVFYPPMVAGFVAAAWAKADVATILDARRRGATAALERILGGKPDGLDRATELLRRAADAGTVAGHPLYAGLLAQEWPGDPIGDFWHAADLVREHRGDGHTCAWVAHGLSAPEVLLLTEAWWGLGLHTYSRTRAWPVDEIDATIASLQERGLLDGEALTPAGEEQRESIEAMTDATEQPVLDALGDDIAELIEILRPWAKAVVDTGGYPTDPASLSRSVPRK